MCVLTGRVILASFLDRKYKIQTPKLICSPCWSKEKQLGREGGTSSPARYGVGENARVPSLHNSPAEIKKSIVC